MSQFEMRTLKKTARAASREDGFTLTELLIASAMMIVLLGAMAMVLMAIVRTQPRVAERSAQIQSGRAMIDRLTRELREGSGVQDASPSSLSFLTYVRRQQCGGSQPPADAGTPAIQCRVTYTCTAGTCMRSETNDGGAGGTFVPLVEGLNVPTGGMQVFQYTPPAPDVPRYVTVTLEYPAQESGESITLSDGAALRNAVG